MFSLIKTIEPSNGLAQVEELIGHQPDIKYTHIQYDEKSSQYIGAIETIPKYFTTNGYMEYLYDNITKFKFVDNCAIYEMVNIPMTKVIKPITIEELQEKIQHLEQIIASLPKQDELIETHIYPSWDTYEDFKKLPSWKYFDASANSANYFIQVEEINRHSNKKPCIFRDKYNDKHVQFQYYKGKYDMIPQLYDTPYSYKIISLDDPLRRYFTIGNGDDYVYKGSGYIAYPTKETEMASIDYNYYHTYHGENKQETLFARTFHKNVKIHYYTRECQIANPVRSYIQYFIAGWFLLNWQYHVSQEIYVNIEITDIVKINIYKSQKKILKSDANTITISLPTIQSVKINGIQYHS
jgi:hypothetical protein